jgi:hypothetical protein
MHRNTITALFLAVLLLFTLSAARQSRSINTGADSGTVKEAPSAPTARQQSDPRLQGLRLKSRAPSPSGSQPELVYFFMWTALPTATRATTSMSSAAT